MTINLVDEYGPALRLLAKQAIADYLKQLTQTMMYSQLTEEQKKQVRANALTELYLQARDDVTPEYERLERIHASGQMFGVRR